VNRVRNAYKASLTAGSVKSGMMGSRQSGCAEAAMHSWPL
jgi:hypothetical protein